jgi:hypothetical protein
MLIAPYSVFDLAQHDSGSFYLTASFYEKAVKISKSVKPVNGASKTLLSPLSTDREVDSGPE